MAEPIITREMLILTLAGLTEENQRYERELKQYREDCSTQIQTITRLREKNELLERSNKAFEQSIDTLNAEKTEWARHTEGLEAHIKRLEKGQCTCFEGPHVDIRTDAPDLRAATEILHDDTKSNVSKRMANESLDQSAEQRIQNLLKRKHELDQTVESLQERLSKMHRTRDVLESELREVKLSRDTYSDSLTGVMTANDGLHATIRELKNKLEYAQGQNEGLARSKNALQNTYNSLYDDYEKLKSKVEDLEQKYHEYMRLRGKHNVLDVKYREQTEELSIAKGKTIPELQAKQCQCVPVLEERIATQREVIKNHETSAGLSALKLSKIRSIVQAGMNSSEMYQSNPPKNVVAYRVLEILDDHD